jgi:hypothetical protein
VGQGEIFTGRLNMHQLYGRIPRTDTDFICFNQRNVDVDVVVKVSSTAVHNYLTDPKEAKSASREICQQLKGTDTEGAISDVLYAVYGMPKGLITIMADLSGDYKILKPESVLKRAISSLLDLWKGFHEMVRHVLLPLAVLGWIHLDIRPGYDVTSNVLCFIKPDRSVAMQLIDYESTLAFKNWNFPQPTDYRYVKRGKSWNATTFLWWQCAAVAYAWKQAIPQDTGEPESHTGI